MKPLRIAFSAFGPFPGEHEVDFDRLEIGRAHV
mgnify:CR=1 FL=1